MFRRRKKRKYLSFLSSFFLIPRTNVPLPKQNIPPTPTRVQQSKDKIKQNQSKVKKIRDAQVSAKTLFSLLHTFFKFISLYCLSFTPPPSPSRLPLRRRRGPGRRSRGLQLRHRGPGLRPQRPQGGPGLFGSLRRDRRPRSRDRGVQGRAVLLQERHEAFVEKDVCPSGSREEEPGEEGDLDLLCCVCGE